MPNLYSVKNFLSVLLLCSCCVAVAQISKPLTGGIIQYNDSALIKILPLGTKVEVIGSGFQHIEGPVWIRDSNILLFSDTKAQIIYRWNEAKGASNFLEHAGYTGRLPYSEEPGSNGLAIEKNGELLLCEHGDRRIAAYPLNGRYGRRTVTDNYDGKRYNSPNDIVIKSDGTVYFSDPPYGLPQKEKDTLKETVVNGVYTVMPDGKAKLLISDLTYPNGLAFSQDEKLLYVSVSDEQRPQIMVYMVKKDNSVSGGKLFFDASVLPRTNTKQITDGLKIDSAGNVWASGPGGLLIINAGGKLLGSIQTGEVISNCAWGDGGSSLYVTAGSFLYRIRTRVKGANLP